MSQRAMIVKNGCGAIFGRHLDLLFAVDSLFCRECSGEAPAIAAIGVRIVRAVMTVYALLALAALLLIPASSFGWFGIARDPLGRMFALILSLPWSPLLDPVLPDSMAGGVIAAATGMAVNVALPWRVARRLGRRA